MYSTSSAYKTAIAASARRTRITGVLTLSGGSTVNLTEADILQGSLSLSEQCVSGDDFAIGSVYASELCVSLITPAVSPWNLAGAKLALSFGLDISGTPTWEDIPLGVYWVTEIDRKETYTFVRALDGMILLDAPLGATNVTAQTIEQLIANACTTAGVTLATTHTTFETFPNKAMVLTLPAGTEVKTCRDLIMWACEINGTFARMNRAGQLEVKPLHSASARTIQQTERYAPTMVSDVAIKVTGVQEQVLDTTYTQGTTSMMLVLLDNPLLRSQSASAINAALTALLADVTLAEYTPYTSEFIGDPSIQAGDYITLADTGALGSNPVGLVTHSLWRFRGRHSLKSVGRPGIVKSTTDQYGKRIQSISADLINADRIIAGRLSSQDGDTYFDLETPEIKQTATINGKTVEVTVSPSKPFELTIDGQKAVYITSDGVLVTSIYDVNEDGIVDDTDVQLIKTYILYGTGYLPRMDVNNDGSVTAMDLLLVRRASRTPGTWSANEVADAQSVLMVPGQDVEFAPRYVLFEDDFLVHDIPTTGASSTNNPLYGIGISSGTFGINAQHVANHPGHVVIKGSGSSGGGAYWSSRAPFKITGGEVFECIFRPDTLTNAYIRIGMHDSVGATDAADGVYIEVLSSGNCYGKTAANSTRSSTGTYYTCSASTWYRVRIEVNDDATSVNFYLYDASGTELWVDSLSTNIPTGSLRELNCIQILAFANNTASQSILSVDWVRFLIPKKYTR